MEINHSDYNAYGASRKWGIYAIELMNGKIIPAEECDDLSMDNLGNIWYRSNNKNNVIQLKEKWMYIPFHAIARIAYND